MTAPVTAGGAQAWVDALQRVALTDADRAWLRAHLTAPGCRASLADLAAATGGEPSAYLALADRLAAAVPSAAGGGGSRWGCADAAPTPHGPHPNPPPPGGGRSGMPAIARWDGEAWILRPEVAFALGVRRVLPDDWDRGSRERSALAAPQGESPIIVLVRPQLADNIGAVARAMANGGLFHLRLVSPRDGWPQDRAWRTASGADRILDAATLHGSVPEAVADCHRVLATCPRPRHVVTPLRTARAAAEDLRGIAARGLRAAVLFGPERAGLENEDIACADALVRYPLNPQHMSLNLAQAVMILAYEWWTAAEATPPRMLVTNETRVATKGELEGFLERLVAELDASGFLDHERKRAGMVRNLRHWFERGEVTEQELRTLHGVVTELSRGRMRRGRPDPEA